MILLLAHLGGFLLLSFLLFSDQGVELLDSSNICSFLTLLPQYLSSLTNNTHRKEEVGGEGGGGDGVEKEEEVRIWRCGKERK